MARLLGLVTAASALLGSVLVLGGCSSKSDPTLTAAPPTEKKTPVDNPIAGKKRMPGAVKPIGL